MSQNESCHARMQEIENPWNQMDSTDWGAEWRDSNPRGSRTCARFPAPADFTAAHAACKRPWVLWVERQKEYLQERKYSLWSECHERIWPSPLKSIVCKQQARRFYPENEIAAYKNLRMSTASCSSKLISRFAISFETSSAASYWFRYLFSDLTPILQPSVIKSAIV